MYVLHSNLNSMNKVPLCNLHYWLCVILLHKLYMYYLSTSGYNLWLRCFPFCSFTVNLKCICSFKHIPYNSVNNYLTVKWKIANKTGGLMTKKGGMAGIWIFMLILRDTELHTHSCLILVRNIDFKTILSIVESYCTLHLHNSGKNNKRPNGTFFTANRHGRIPWWRFILCHSSQTNKFKQRRGIRILEYPNSVCPHVILAKSLRI